MLRFATQVARLDGLISTLREDLQGLSSLRHRCPLRTLATRVVGLDACLHEAFLFRLCYGVWAKGVSISLSSRREIGELVRRCLCAWSSVASQPRASLPAVLFVQQKVQEKLTAVEVAIDLIGRRLDLLRSPLNSSGSLHQDRATPAGPTYHDVAAVETLWCGGCRSLCSQVDPLAAALREFVASGLILLAQRDRGALMKNAFSAWRDLPSLPSEVPSNAVPCFAARAGAAPVPADRLGFWLLWIDTATTAEAAAATVSFLCEEASRHLAALDALQARVDRCESLIATNQTGMGELHVLAVPLLSTFDAEVERVFKVHLQEELASRFYAFLGVERFSFIEFVRSLEDEAFRKISAHFHAARRAHAPSLPA